MASSARQDGRRQTQTVASRAVTLGGSRTGRAILVEPGAEPLAIGLLDDVPEVLLHGVVS
jgi:hypothetical protein